jgi:hypothetical protein
MNIDRFAVIKNRYKPMHAGSIQLFEINFTQMKRAWQSLSQ